jgi:hypothetical protein
MLKDRSTPIQSSNDKWFPKKKKILPLKTSYMVLIVKGKMIILLNDEYIHDESMISFSFCFNSFMVS